MSQQVAHPLLAGARPLTDGQVVTVLVGIALELAALHANGQTYGSLHPVHVSLDDSGRPRLQRIARTSSWSERDDVRAIIRLGCSLADSRGQLHALLKCQAQGQLQSIDSVIEWLLSVCNAERVDNASRC